MTDEDLYDPDGDHDDDDDQLLLVESDHDYDDEDDDAGGLEVDDQQAREVERIFLTTLPQYLEPAEEMADQLLSEEREPSPEVQHALVTTVTSLAAAAQRMGIDDVHQRLDELSRAVEQIDLGAGAPTAEQRQAVYDALRAVTAICDGGGERSRPDDEGSMTIFAALGNMEGVDDSALSRLTAAGVVNVGQLLMADPDEVVAVSGLSEEVVATILRQLRPEEAEADDGGGDVLEELGDDDLELLDDGGDDGIDEPADVSALDRLSAIHDLDDVDDDHAPDDAAAPTPNVVELPLAEGALQAQLDQRLRAQVEAEAAVVELRAAIQQLRARATALRTDVQRAEARRDAHRHELASASERLSSRMAARSRLRARRGELALEISAAEDARREEEKRIAELREEHEATLANHDRFERQVAGLAEHVRRLLESTQGR